MEEKPHLGRAQSQSQTVGIGYRKGYRLVISQRRSMDALAVIEATSEARRASGLN
jgi:hypothetical protein